MVSCGTGGKARAGAGLMMAVSSSERGGQLEGVAEAMRKNQKDAQGTKTGEGSSGRGAMKRALVWAGQLPEKMVVQVKGA